VWFLPRNCVPEPVCLCTLKLYRFRPVGIWVRAGCALVSQNPRMVRVGRDLCGSSSPTPLPKQGHLQQAVCRRSAEDGGRNALPSCSRPASRRGSLARFGSGERPGSSVRRADLPPPAVLGTVPGHVLGTLGGQVGRLVPEVKPAACGCPWCGRARLAALGGRSSAAHGGKCLGPSWSQRNFYPLGLLRTQANREESFLEETELNCLKSSPDLNILLLRYTLFYIIKNKHSLVCCFLYNRY